jgi:hypothetical protein
LLSTPRAGNNWLRYLLTRAFDIPGAAVHSPAEVDWEGLPRECVLGIHWPPVPSFLERLQQYGFRALVLARHPLDVLISILHFALHYAGSEATQRWLEGEGGNERPIFAAMPRSTAFMNYAVGKRAKNLLAVSHDWWQVPGCLRVRYEDLARQTDVELARLADELGVPLRKPVAEVLEATTIAKLRAFTGSRSHFWQGKAGLWRQLLTDAETAPLAAAHSAVVADLSYPCDADPDLDAAQADANWVSLAWSELAEDLAHLRTNNLVVKNLRTTEEKLAAVQAQRDAEKVELSALVGRFTAVQQQLLDVQVTYQDMVEKLTASQLALGDVQARHSMAQQAASAAESQVHALRAEQDELAAHLRRLREDYRVAASELAQARERLAVVADLGPRAIRLARKIHRCSQRFPRFASLVRLVLPERPKPQCQVPA